MTNKTKILISILLVIFGVGSRLLPHIWNFAPIAGIALFSSVYLGKKYAFILSITVMLLGDIFLGFYAWPIMLAVYGSYLLIVCFGFLVKKYKSFETILAGSVLSSIIFFAVTNFAVWQFSSWYSHSLHGLIECYTMALPFFRNTLLGNVFYVGILFGGYEMVSLIIKQRDNHKIILVRASGTEV